MIRRLLLALAAVGAVASHALAQEVAQPAERTASPPQAEGTASSAAGGHVAVQVNLAGLLQYGLVPGIEFGGERLSVSLRYRAITTGALSGPTFADSADDEELKRGWSVGGAVRYYQGRAGPLRDWFFGAGLEYAYVRVEDTTVDRQRYESWAVVTYGEVGYRWVWTHFFTEAGVMAGASRDTKETWTSLDTGVASPGEKESGGFLMGSFQIGWML